MKILIDARPIIKDFAGVGSYVYNLLKGFKSSAPEIDFDVLSYDVAGEILDLKGKNINYKYVDRRLRKLLTASFDIFNLPLTEMLFGKHDIIHQTFFSTLPTANKRTKIISTIHDVIFLSFPECFTRNNLLISERALKKQLVSSDKIIADSEFTKLELVKKCRVAEDRIEVIYLGIDEKLNDYSAPIVQDIKNKYGICGKYAIFIGTIEPRKNLITLFRAFSMLKEKEVKLVIVGKKGWFYEKIFNEVEKLHLKDRVVFTGYVSTYDKGALLSGAEMFVFPSIYEGFGIPVVEAMASGLPIIAGNNSTMPELLGDAGILVEILNAEEIARNIDRLLIDDEARLKYCTLSKEQAKAFSWKTTVSKTLSLYKKMCGN